tara:strand:- start:512 stop:1348 length:837 start_codon:yes stop_codon:yes gene_type:complete
MARTTSAAALNKLRSYIFEQSFCSGDQLPAERALSASIGCSRQTLRHCLKTLQAEGILWRHVGQGTFYGSQPLNVPVRETILIEATSPTDLMEARLLLEPQVAAEAARKATNQEVTYLRRKLHKGRLAPDHTRCEMADDAFHTTIARMSHNPVLIALFTFLSGPRRRATWQRQWNKTYRSFKETEYQSEQYEQHKVIVDAIAASDPTRARDAMNRHMEIVYAEMLRPRNKLASFSMVTFKLKYEAFVCGWSQISFIALPRRTNYHDLVNAVTLGSERK